MRLTPVVRNLLYLNIGVFLIQYILPEFSGYGILFPPGSGLFMPHQIITHMFMHAGFSHILFNMLGLIFMGPILEQTIGDKRFLILTVVSGLGAVFLQLASGYLLGNSAPMLGFSGVVIGIVVATAIYYPNIEVMIYFLFPVKLKYLAIFYVIYDLFNGLTNHSSNVAHFAHLGGALFAVLLLKYWRSKNNFR